MLADRLRRRIERDGPMPFDRFMAACLYDPAGGFFATGPLRSAAAGDFLTSPEVSPWFGRILARFVDEERRRIGSEKLSLVEIGAGSGALLEPLLDELDGLPGDRVWAVEVSPAARAALGSRLGARVRIVPSLDALPAPLTGVVIANEVADNLPVALAVRRGSSWDERFVAWRRGFRLLGVPARTRVAAWAERRAAAVPNGTMVEVQLAAGAWLRDLLTLVVRGAVLIADYGGTTEELAPRRTRGTLRTYRAHHLGPDPLEEPGATDVTVDVDFSALADVARDGGWDVTVERQDDMLARWGLRDVLRELREREVDLAREGSAMDRLAVRSERTDAETLLHPRGLGDFRFLIARR